MNSAKVRVGFALAVMGAVVTGLWACSTEPPPNTEATLSLSSAKKILFANGSSTDINVSALEADGTPGAGSVTFTSLRGDLGGTGATTDTVDLVNGRGSTKFACNKDPDIDCVGTHKITADWKGITANITITMQEPPGLDAGLAGPDASSVDTGFGLHLKAERSIIYFAVGDSTSLTASLSRGDAGIANQTIQFSTTLGGFYIGVDGGVPTPNATMDLTTNAEGVAVVDFTGDFVATPKTGSAAITATHLQSGQVATTKVDIVGVSSVAYKSLNCPQSGATCTMLGLKGSQWNETGDVAFEVKDAANKPVVGLPVTFSFVDAPPDGTTIDNAVVSTDGTGIAKVKVRAGTTIGVVKVKATAVAGANPKEAISPAIGIRAAKASNSNFVFTCETLNLPVYISATPPAAYTVKCNVKLYDRYNNPIGIGATVNFKTEAGGIDTQVVTKAYVAPPGDNSGEGTATINFTSTGLFPPTDTTPLVADPGQWPYARVSEPSVGSPVRNPRDGLVTLVAYVKGGEEYFKDDNVNGVWDPGESFIDQSTPYIDVDDSNVYESGAGDVPIETYAAPNGTWDSNTTIWTEARILYTGAPAGAIVPNAGWSVPVSNPASTVTLDVFFTDQNFNRVTAKATSFAVAHSATRGSVKLSSTSLLDNYGFDLERKLVNAADGRECVMGTTAICRWKTLFKDWYKGYIGYVTVTGATTPMAGDASAGMNDRVTVTATVPGTTNPTATSDGVIF